MDLRTYDGLKQAVADWLMRDDLEPVIPTFIAMAEADFNRQVRSREMVIRSDAIADGAYRTLPGDFLEMRSLYLPDANPPRRLEFVSIEEAVQARNRQMTGFPRFFSIQGRTLELIPAPTDDLRLEMVYYGRIPALAEGRPSNWLLETHPDLYLHGALVQSAPYLKDDERIAVWGALKEQAVEAINRETQRAEFSGGALKMRARTI